MNNSIRKSTQKMDKFNEKKVEDNLNLERKHKICIFVRSSFIRCFTKPSFIMKRILLLLCAVALLAVACDKDEPAQDTNNNTNPSDTTHTEYPPTQEMIYNAVTDIDGNSYDAVLIGSQVWMASNLRTTRYANGDSIPEKDTISAIDPCRYAPSTDVATYGYLYNWPAVMHGEPTSSHNPSGVQGICPDGWHVPSDAEWTQLISYCGNYSVYVCNGIEKNIAKSLAAEYGWQLYEYNECAVGNNQSANNTIGFGALPAGNYGGSFSNFGNNAYYWSATGHSSSDSYYRCLYYNSTSVSRSYSITEFGFSVRCVRD